MAIRPIHATYYANIDDSYTATGDGTVSAYWNYDDVASFIKGGAITSGDRIYVTGYRAEDTYSLMLGFGVSGTYDVELDKTTSTSGFTDMFKLGPNAEDYTYLGMGNANGKRYLHVDGAILKNTVVLDQSGYAGAEDNTYYVFTNCIFYDKLIVGSNAKYLFGGCTFNNMTPGNTEYATGCLSVYTENNSTSVAISEDVDPVGGSTSFKEWYPGTYAQKWTATHSFSVSAIRVNVSSFNGFMGSPRLQCAVAIYQYPTGNCLAYGTIDKLSGVSGDYDIPITTVPASVVKGSNYYIVFCPGAGNTANLTARNRGIAAAQPITFLWGSAVDPYLYGWTNPIEAGEHFDNGWVVAAYALGSSVGATTLSSGGTADFWDCTFIDSKFNYNNSIDSSQMGGMIAECHTGWLTKLSFKNCVFDSTSAEYFSQFPESALSMIDFDPHLESVFNWKITKSLPAFADVNPNTLTYSEYNIPYMRKVARTSNYLADTYFDVTYPSNINYTSYYSNSKRKGPGCFVFGTGTIFSGSDFFMDNNDNYVDLNRKNNVDSVGGSVECPLDKDQFIDSLNYYTTDFEIYSIKGNAEYNSVSFGSSLYGSLVMKAWDAEKYGNPNIILNNSTLNLGNGYRYLYDTFIQLNNFIGFEKNIMYCSFYDCYININNTSAVEFNGNLSFNKCTLNAINTQLSASSGTSLTFVSAIINNGDKTVISASPTDTDIGLDYCAVSYANSSAFSQFAYSAATNCQYDYDAPSNEILPTNMQYRNTLRYDLLNVPPHEITV